jgi:hypothetical protein
MYSLHEGCLVIAEDIEDLVLKLGCDWELLGTKSDRRCVSGRDSAQVSGKRGLAAAGLLVQVDKWVDWVEAAKVDTVAGNRCREGQRHSGNRELGVVGAAGRMLGARIDWTW